MFQHIWTYEKHPGYDVRPVSVVHLHQLPASRSGRSFWRPSPHSQAAERSPAALSDSMVHRRRRGCRGRRSREASQAFRGDGGGSELMDSRSFHLDTGGWCFQTIYLGKSFVQGHKKPSNIISWGRNGSSRSCQKSKKPSLVERL